MNTSCRGNHLCELGTLLTLWKDTALRRLGGEKGVRRCVCGCVDPFAKVQGRGIQKIREAGIEVTVGVLEKECLELNKRFITYNTHQRPYVILKWAQTANGFSTMRARAWRFPRPLPRCSLINFVPRMMPSS